MSSHAPPIPGVRSRETSATDQASRLRAMMRASAPATGRAVPARRAAPIVAIASGKGGVGKTSLAVNLSIALASSGTRVTLLDADLGMANADVLCGLAPQRRLDDLLGDPEALRDGRQKLSSIVVDAPGGFRLVPGAVGVARVSNLDAQTRSLLASHLAELTHQCDVMLIDTGAGIGRDVMAFVRAADLLLVVATPEPTSVADAYGLLKCAALGASTPPRAGLVVTHARSGTEAQGVTSRISGCCERFLRMNVPLLGVVRLDPRVPRAVRRRSPHQLACPRCRASRDVERIARSLSVHLGLTRGIGGV